MWNLGVTTSLFSVLLAGDWKWARPINVRLWYLGDLLHIHAGNVVCKHCWKIDDLSQMKYV